jgi:hypothetical protein
MYAITGLLLARIVMLMPMFTKTLFLALLFVSGSAFAEWRLLTEGVSGNRFFIDPATIRKDGNIRSFWMKVEIKTPEADDVRSSRAKFEIDCKQETIRFLNQATFAEPNFMGKMLSDRDFPYAPPALIAPETVNNTYMRQVCK